MGAIYNLSFNPSATNRLILCNAKEALTFVMKNYTSSPCQTWSKYAMKRLSRHDNDNSDDVSNSKAKKLRKKEGKIEENIDSRACVIGDVYKDGEGDDECNEEKDNNNDYYGEDTTCDVFCSLDDSKNKDRKTCFSSIREDQKGCLHKVCYVCV